jgi:hypothetical protein
VNLEEGRKRTSRYLGEESLKQALACTAGEIKDETKCEPYSRENLEEYLNHGIKTTVGLQFVHKFGVRGLSSLLRIGTWALVQG